jgi:adenosylcobinamide kinase/adenosylcobinamide-phosphate guanylyltransferase
MTKPRTEAARLPVATLVLGGARSGKSRHAEALVAAHAEACGATRVYVATGEALDEEMRARIAQHRRQRGPGWVTREAPLDLVGTLVAEASPARIVLVDCLTLWLSNLMHAGRDVDAETDRLVRLVRVLEGPVVFVANEVGLGIVPDNALARAFRDHAGRMNQALAAAVPRVHFVAAGLALALKDDDGLGDDVT